MARTIITNNADDICQVDVLHDGKQVFTVAWDIDTPGDLHAAVQMCREWVLTMYGDVRPRVSGSLREALAEHLPEFI